MGQLPMERITPYAVFDKVSIDFAGPIYIKQGSVHKPTILKAYPMSVYLFRSPSKQYTLNLYLI